MIPFAKVSQRFKRFWLVIVLLFSFTSEMGLAASSLPTPKEPIVTRSGAIWFRFPVAWELLRSGFNALDVALEAENYAEYWALLYLGPDEIELFTPRGHTRVIGIQSQSQNNSGYPDLLILNEGEFSRLLGLTPDPTGLEKTIFIELPMRDSNEQNFTLNASPKYFVSIQLTINF